MLSRLTCKGQWSRYAFAFLGVSIATLVNLGMASYLSGRVPFAPFYVAAAVVTFACGFVPGMVALVAGGVSAQLFFEPVNWALPFPVGQPALRLGVYAIAGTIIVAATGALREMLDELEDTRNRLNGKVGELSQLNEELALARRQADEANAAKSRFLVQASHDLRQPIHAIGLFVECLKGMRLGREGDELLRQIDRSVATLSRLFGSLLDISAIDTGRIQPNLVDVSVDDVICEVVRQCAEFAHANGVSLRQVRTSARIRTDPALLHAILQNLLSNAVKYAAGARVLVGCRRTGRTIALEVLDGGPGMAAENLPRIFDEFVRLEVAGQPRVEGLGLGLSIVRRLTDLLGLRISVRSQLGRGTVVRISGFQPANGEQAVPAAPEAAGSSDQGLQGLKVLLVEDDAAVREGTARLLARWGCTVEATHVMPATILGFDLLLIDYDLGTDSRTGLEAMQLLRRTDASVPAVLVTGVQAPSVQQAASEAGMPILPKPIRPAQLRSTLLAAALVRSQTRPAAAAIAAAAARVETPSALNKAAT
jgi:signal transduction histidine kinase/FixJ family two-component response regulator